jgi:hypothetical protein
MYGEAVSALTTGTATPTSTISATTRITILPNPFFFAG